MKKVYLLVLLVFASLVSRSQSDYDVIRRNVFSSPDDVVMPPDVGTHVTRAMRSSKDVSEQAVTSFVITHDHIVRNGYITLCDVLKMVPGIRVSQPQSGELGEAFMQRGLLGNTYTKILINGVETRPQGNYGMPLGANIPIRQADEIVVVYGPASASYGIDACSGVIDIRTRKPEKKQFTSADIMLGTGSSCYLNFHSGTKIGHGKYVGQFVIYGSNYSAMDLNVPKDDDLYNRWNYFFQNEKKGEVFRIFDNSGNGFPVTRTSLRELYSYSDALSALKLYNVNFDGSSDHPFYTPEICNIPQRATTVGTEFSIGHFTLTYNAMHRMDFSDLGQSPFVYNYSDGRNMMGELIHRFTLSSDFSVGRFTSNTSARFISYRMDKNSSRGVNWSSEPQYAYAASDEVGVDETFSLVLFSNEETKRKMALNAGASWQYYGVLPPTVECERKFDFHSYRPFAKSVSYEDEVFGSFGINPYTAWQAGAFLLAEFDFNRLSLSGGTRYDYSSLWSHSVNPRVTAMYYFGGSRQISARASFGKSYKVPSPAQIYYCTAVGIQKQYDGVTVPCISVHHMPSDMDEIHPEEIASYELGLTYRFSIRKDKPANNYLELVAYNNIVKDPLVRTWSVLDPNIYPEPYYMGRTDFFSQNASDRFTRAYANEKDANTELYSIQAIAVVRDIYEPINLAFTGSYTYTVGHESLYKEDSESGSPMFQTVDYIRGTPKRQAQFSIDMDFLGGRVHCRFDNIFSSKIARTYYLTSDNPYFWAPGYYNLDASITVAITKDKHLHGILKVSNLTNALYGGIDVKSMDVDLPFNPQYYRSLRFGVTYDF